MYIRDTTIVNIFLKQNYFFIFLICLYILTFNWSIYFSYTNEHTWLYCFTCTIINLFNSLDIGSVYLFNEGVSKWVVYVFKHLIFHEFCVFYMSYRFWLNKNFAESLFLYIQQLSFDVLKKNQIRNQIYKKKPDPLSDDKCLWMNVYIVFRAHIFVGIKMLSIKCWAVEILA